MNSQRILHRRGQQVGLLCFGACQFVLTITAWGDSSEPVSSFTARLIGGINVLVGAPDGTEGTPWKSSFIEAKEATSDRAVLEYDLLGRTPVQSAILNLRSGNLDSPNYLTLSLYSFTGNGLANAADYFRLDNFITSFTDFGVDGTSFSLDITPTYNQFLNQGTRYLGLVIKGTIGSGQGYARYDFAAYPTLATIPEPATLGSFGVAMALVGCAARIRKRPLPPQNLAAAYYRGCP